MSQHIEFPHLTREANAALEVALAAHRRCKQCTFEAAIRESCAAFLREAMKRSESRYGLPPWDNLAAIADSLHSPPPTPPTLAQAQEAARQLGGEDAVIVRAFLATLGKGVQP